MIIKISENSREPIVTTGRVASYYILSSVKEKLGFGTMLAQLAHNLAKCSRMYRDKHFGGRSNHITVPTLHRVTDVTAL